MSTTIHVQYYDKRPELIIETNGTYDFVGKFLCVTDTHTGGQTVQRTYFDLTDVRHIQSVSDVPGYLVENYIPVSDGAPVEKWMKRQAGDDVEVQVGDFTNVVKGVNIEDIT